MTTVLGDLRPILIRDRWARDRDDPIGNHRPAHYWCRIRYGVIARPDWFGFGLPDEKRHEKGCEENDYRDERGHIAPQRPESPPRCQRLENFHRSWASEAHYRFAVSGSRPVTLAGEERSSNIRVAPTQRSASSGMAEGSAEAVCNPARPVAA